MDLRSHAIFDIGEHKAPSSFARVDKWSHLLNQVTLTVENFQGGHHGVAELFRVLPVGKVKPVHVAGVAPLVECRRRLVVLEILQYGTVDHHLQQGR